MKQRIELNIEPRDAGKHFNRTNRKNGLTPAVIYGANVENANVCVSEKDVIKYNVGKFDNALFTLKSKDSKLNGKVVLIKEVTVHPVNRKPRHVDLFAIDLTKTVRVFVEVKLEGKAIGLSEGGLLNVVNRMIEIECLPTEIPENISADVSNLGLGDALHVSDLTLPKGVKAISTSGLTIAVVNKEEEMSTTTAAPAAADAAAPAAPAAGAAAPKKEEAKAPAKK